MRRLPFRALFATAGVLAAAALWGFWAAPGPSVSAAPVVYDIVLKGTAMTLDRTKTRLAFPGTLTYDAQTGELSFLVTQETENGPVDYTGQGEMGVGPKAAFAVTDFVGTHRASQTQISSGTALFNGKFTKDGSRFKAKFQVATPRAIPTIPFPNGFSFTSGKVAGRVAQAQ